jgi:hypothetical protein
MSIRETSQNAVGPWVWEMKSMNRAVCEMGQHRDWMSRRITAYPRTHGMKSPTDVTAAEEAALDAAVMDYFRTQRPHHVAHADQPNERLATYATTHLSPMPIAATGKTKT